VVLMLATWRLGRRCFCQVPDAICFDRHNEITNVEALDAVCECYSAIKMR